MHLSPTALLFLAASACALADEEGEDSSLSYVRADSTVILISLDGFRPDYLERVDTPVLDRIAQEGVWAEGLVPVFPSNTFPSHYSMVTGLYPANHGVIDNIFYAPDLSDTFHMGDQAHHTEARWWGGEPIWSTAEQQGLTAATMFWVGSEVERSEDQAHTWMEPYDGSLPFEDRVDGVLGWLDDPEQAPRLVTLYFQQPDSAGHAHGPHHAEVGTQVSRVDEALGRLITGLEGREALEQTDLLVVSDHGMAQTDPERVVLLDDYLDLDLVWVHRWGSWASIWPKDDSQTDAIVEALQQAPHATCARREGLPAHLMFSEGERVPPVACVADTGAYLTYSGWNGQLIEGMHGYDSADPKMHGIFLGRGPHLAQGKTLERFENIHIHALLTWMLDLDAPDGVDARLDPVKDALRHK